ncbi:MAG: hypothetical protein AAFY84_03635 [Pseudomonadota bacterium]
MQLVRKACALLALMLVFAVIMTGALAAVYGLPNGTIAKNIKDDLPVLLQRRANNGRVIDADTECIGLSVGLYRSPDAPTPPFERSVLAESVYGCAPFEKLLDGEEPKAHRDYFRYWHGYTLVSRPLLSVMSYASVRGVIFTLSIGLLGWLLWRLGKDFGAPLALAVGLPFVVLNALGFWVVVTKAVSWFLAIGGSIAVGRRIGQAPYLLFGIIGMLTAAFDFLTIPALIFSLPAIVWLFYQSQRDVRERFVSVLWLGVFFGIGYIGFWSLKVGLAATVLDRDVIADVLASVGTRLRGADPTIDSFWPGQAVWANIGALKTIWGLVFAGLVVACLAWPQSRQRLVGLARSRPDLTLVAVIPLVWLEVLSNHSQIHAAFTHLNFAPALMVVGLALFGVERIYPISTSSIAKKPD